MGQCVDTGRTLLVHKKSPASAGEIVKQCPIVFADDSADLLSAQVEFLRQALLRWLVDVVLIEDIPVCRVVDALTDQGLDLAVLVNRDFPVLDWHNVAPSLRSIYANYYR